MQQHISFELVKAQLEPRLKQQLKELAAANERSVAAEIRVALRSHVAAADAGEDS